MKKRSLLISGLSIGLVTAAMAIATAPRIVGAKTPSFERGEGIYTLTLDGDNAPTTSSSFESVTYTGIDECTFKFDNIKYETDALGRFGEGGKFYKSELTYGIESITVNFTGEVNIYTDFEVKAKAKCETVLTDIESGVEHGICGNFFMIVCPTETVINSVVIKYGCVATSAKTGHSFGTDDWTVTTPATLDAEGVESHACSVCGKVEERAIQQLHGIEFINSKHRIEAEDYTGVSGSVNISDSEGKSGGKTVGDFAYGDSLSYEFLVESACTAYIEVSAACGIESSGNGAVEIAVNGATLGNYGDLTSWSDYQLSSSKEFDLVRGKNTVQLIGPYGSFTNLDYFDIVLTPKFVEGVARIEAENYTTISGGAKVSDPVEGETLSGGHGIGDFNLNVGHLTYDVYVREEMNVTISVAYACGIENNDNGAVEVHLNDTKLNNLGSKSDWHDWRVATTKVAKLNAGKNTIALHAPYGSYTNLDYFELNYIAHTCSNVCEYCGKCKDETCLEQACASKCPGHPVLDLSNGYQIFESEDGFNFSGCAVYSNEKAHGGKGVGGNWSYNNYYEFDFVVTEDIDVRFNACGAITTPLTVNNNGLCEIHIDGGGNHENIGYGQWSGAEDAYHVYTEYEGKKTVTLTEGYHVIRVLCPYAATGNIDYVKIVTAPHECGHVCEICGKCTDPNCEDPVCEAKCGGHSTKLVTLEAEYAARSSSLSVLARNSDTSHKTSNNLCVGGFSDGDNQSLTFTFNSSAAVTVKLSIWAANCSGLTSFDAAFNVKVNNTAKTTETGTLKANDGVHWYYFEKVVYENIAIVSGTNTISLTNKAKYGVNIDSIDIEVLDTVEITTPYIGKIEAEDSEITGTPSGNAKITGYQKASETPFYNVNTKDSNGASVGNWYKGDTNLHSYFSVDKDTNVYIVVHVTWASENDTSIKNRIYGFGIDGYQTTGSFSTTAEGSITADNSYHDWIAIMRLDSIAVAAGQHYVHIEASDGANLNIDAVTVVSADATATVTSLGVHTA